MCFSSPSKSFRLNMSLFPTLEELLAKNDLELYDLHEHPEEMNNLATDPIKHGELLVTLNKITSDLLAAEVTNPRREKVFSTSKQTLRAFDVGASRRRRRVRAIAAALLVVIPAPPMAAEMNCNTAGNGRSPTTNTVASDDLSLHFFGNTTHLQATSDQVGLATQTGPLPISISGNVQSWTSGSPLRDLYTESAQGFYQLNQNWRILGQQLYQQQGSITLSNFVGGVNFRPKNDLSFNVTVGAGVHTLYTYQWSAYLSPQYRLPWTVCGRKPVALELDTTFENYVLGNFSQATPKIDLDLTSWLPQLQIGYAFGDFDNTTSVHPTQYYQPQAIRGVTFTAVAHPLDQMYVVVSYLPANRNYIAGSYVTQNTFGGTVHWNLTAGFRLSFYGEDSWYEGGSDRALGGGVSFAF